MNIALPRIEAVCTAPDGVDVHARVEADLPYFEGHFPGQPVVPGVVQLGWAISLTRAHLHAGEDTPLLRVEVLKFHQVIAPHTPIVIELRTTGRARRTRFSISSPGVAHSSGRLQWQDP